MAPYQVWTTVTLSRSAVRAKNTFCMYKCDVSDIIFCALMVTNPELRNVAWKLQVVRNAVREMLRLCHAVSHRKCVLLRALESSNRYYVAAARQQFCGNRHVKNYARGIHRIKLSVMHVPVQCVWLMQLRTLRLIRPRLTHNHTRARFPR